MNKCNCGAEAKMVVGHSNKTGKLGYFILCTCCDFSTHIHDTEAEAEAEWDSMRRR